MGGYKSGADDQSYTQFVPTESANIAFTELMQQKPSGENVREKVQIPPPIQTQSGKIVVDNFQGEINNLIKNLESESERLTIKFSNPENASGINTANQLIGILNKVKEDAEKLNTNLSEKDELTPKEKQRVTELTKMFEGFNKSKGGNALLSVPILMQIQKNMDIFTKKIEASQNLAKLMQSKPSQPLPSTPHNQNSTQKRGSRQH